MSLPMIFEELKWDRIYRQNHMNRIHDTMLPPILELLDAITLRTRPPEAPDAIDKPMPPTLLTWIESWGDTWAIQGQKAYAEELYREHKDWGRVMGLMKADIEESVHRTED